MLDAGISPDGVRRAIATAAAARPHEVAVYVQCAAGPGAEDRLRAGLTDTGDPVRGTGEPLEARAAFGSPADVAAIIAAYHAAGATSVVLQPTGDDPDVDATLALGAEAIALLAR